MSYLASVAHLPSLSAAAAPPLVVAPGHIEQRMSEERFALILLDDRPIWPAVRLVVGMFADRTSVCHFAVEHRWYHYIIAPAATISTPPDRHGRQNPPAVPSRGDEPALIGPDIPEAWLPLR